MPKQIFSAKVVLKLSQRQFSFKRSLLTSHALLVNRGLMCLNAGGSVQHMTGQNMQNHSQRRRAGRNCEVGEGAEEYVCVLGSRWVYLHTSLQHCKTHPDTPHWDDEKSRGEGQEGEKDIWGGHKQRCTVPKPEWANVTRAKNTREKERVIHYFTPMQHAENRKLYNKHFNINRLLLLFHCMLFTQMSHRETGNFSFCYIPFSFFSRNTNHTCYIPHILRDPWYPEILHTLKIGVDIKCV